MLSNLSAISWKDLIFVWNLNAEWSQVRVEPMKTTENKWLWNYLTKEKFLKNRFFVCKTCSTNVQSSKMFSIVSKLLNTFFCNGCDKFEWSLYKKKRKSFDKTTPNSRLCWSALEFRSIAAAAFIKVICQVCPLSQLSIRTMIPQRLKFQVWNGQFHALHA